MVRKVRDSLRILSVTLLMLSVPSAYADTFEGAVNLEVGHLVEVKHRNKKGRARAFDSNARVVSSEEAENPDCGFVAGQWQPGTILDDETRLFLSHKQRAKNLLADSRKEKKLKAKKKLVAQAQGFQSKAQEEKSLCRDFIKKHVKVDFTDARALLLMHDPLKVASSKSSVMGEGEIGARSGDTTSRGQNYKLFKITDGGLLPAGPFVTSSAESLPIIKEAKKGNDGNIYYFLGGLRDEIRSDPILLDTGKSAVKDNGPYFGYSRKDACIIGYTGPSGGVVQCYMTIGDFPLDAMSFWNSDSLSPDLYKEFISGFNGSSIFTLFKNVSNAAGWSTSTFDLYRYLPGIAPQKILNIGNIALGSAHARPHPDGGFVFYSSELDDDLFPINVSVKYLSPEGVLHDLVTPGRPKWFSIFPDYKIYVGFSFGGPNSNRGGIMRFDPIAPNSGELYAGSIELGLGESVSGFNCEEGEFYICSSFGAPDGKFFTEPRPLDITEMASGEVFFDPATEMSTPIDYRTKFKLYPKIEKIEFPDDYNIPRPLKRVCPEGNATDWNSVRDCNGFIRQGIKAAIGDNYIHQRWNFRGSGLGDSGTHKLSLYDLKSNAFFDIIPNEAGIDVYHLVPKADHSGAYFVGVSEDYDTGYIGEVDLATKSYRILHQFASRGIFIENAARDGLIVDDPNGINIVGSLIVVNP